ncbi:intercellular adhesion molecule 1-like [Carettochelys insculpta]|uniref:intercellular adhesion molecule 1-like n=1 Tax=Carettochelys insculpta TaxID=44489 RepID=UPI003EC077CA
MRARSLPGGLWLGALLCALPLGHPSACRLSITPKDPAVPFGGHVILNCTSSCAGESSLGWETPERKVMEVGPGWASLNITNLQMWDLQPLCYITSTNIMEKARLHVYRLLPPEIHLGAKIVAGHREQVICNVSSLVAGSSPSDINVTLSTAGRPLSESHGDPAVGYSFVAQPTQHGQEIVCQAMLRVGHQVLSAWARTTLHVWAPPHSVQVSVERLLFQVGANITVRCSAQGNPQPELQWELPSEASVELSEHGRTVAVRSAQLTHSGTYRCLARNDYGSSSGHVSLFVKNPPRSRILTGLAATVVPLTAGLGMMQFLRKRPTTT